MTPSRPCPPQVSCSGDLSCRNNCGVTSFSSSTCLFVSNLGQWARFQCTGAGPVVLLTQSNGPTTSTNNFVGGGDDQSLNPPGSSRRLAGEAGYEEGAVEGAVM